MGFESKLAYWRVLSAAAPHYKAERMGELPADEDVQAVLSQELERYLPKGTLALVSRLESREGVDAAGAPLLANGVQVRVPTTERTRSAFVAISLCDSNGSRRSSAALRKTLRHETLHALRASGIFTAEEWDALRTEALLSWRERYDVESRWKDYYGAKWGMNDATVQEALDEEAIAERFAEWAGEGDGALREKPEAELPLKRAGTFLDAVGGRLRGLFGIGEKVAVEERGGWRKIFEAVRDGRAGSLGDAGRSADADRQEAEIIRALDAARAAMPGIGLHVEYVGREDGRSVPALVCEPSFLCLVAASRIDDGQPGTFLVYDAADLRCIGPAVADPVAALGAMVAADGELGGKSLAALRLDSAADVGVMLERAVGRVRAANLAVSGVIEAHLDAAGFGDRSDGPALIYANGREVWMRDGRVHREGGPADVSPEGGRKWFADGRPHRADGPAVESPDGSMRWFADGIERKPTRSDLASYLHRAPEPQREYVFDRSVGGIFVDSSAELRLDGLGGVSYAISDVIRNGKVGLSLAVLSSGADGIEVRTELGAPASLNDALARAGRDLSDRGLSTVEDGTRMLGLKLLSDQPESGARLLFDASGRLSSMNGEPSMVDAAGNAEWHENGVLSRGDGPAIETRDGGWGWYEKGRPRVPSGEELMAYAGNAPPAQRSDILSSSIGGVYADLFLKPLECSVEGESWRIGRSARASFFYVERKEGGDW